MSKTLSFQIVPVFINGTTGERQSFAEAGVPEGLTWPVALFDAFGNYNGNLDVLLADKPFPVQCEIQPTAPTDGKDPYPVDNTAAFYLGLSFAIHGNPTPALVDGQARIIGLDPRDGKEMPDLSPQQEQYFASFRSSIPAKFSECDETPRLPACFARIELYIYKVAPVREIPLPSCSYCWDRYYTPGPYYMNTAALNSCLSNCS